MIMKLIIAIILFTLTTFSTFANEEDVFIDGLFMAIDNELSIDELEFLDDLLDESLFE